MNRLLVSAVVALPLLLAPVRTYSCECSIRGDGSAKWFKWHSKAVFIGEVLEIRAATKAESKEDSAFLIVRVRVERYWKGIQSGEVNVTYLPGCPPYFRQGEKFLIYAMGKRLNTCCTRTRSLDSAGEDLAVLGKPKRWEPNSKTPWVSVLGNIRHGRV